MQLLRETEYTLRVLNSIGKRLEKTGNSHGASIHSISIETGLSRSRVLRICEKLEAIGLIASRITPDNKKVFFPEKILADLTLKDVLDITDHGVDLFAIFERSSPLYLAQKQNFDKLQSKIEKIITDFKLKSLWE